MMERKSVTTDPEVSFALTAEDTHTMETAPSNVLLVIGTTRENALRSAESALVLVTPGYIAICLFLEGTQDETETDVDSTLHPKCTLEGFKSRSRSSTPPQLLPQLP
jgi:hypothetical protein